MVIINLPKDVDVLVAQKVSLSSIVVGSESWPLYLKVEQSKKEFEGGVSFRRPEGVTNEKVFRL